MAPDLQTRIILLLLILDRHAAGLMEALEREREISAALSLRVAQLEGERRALP